jgi:hypothetical protein
VRTTFEFSAAGVSHEDLKQKTEEVVAKFLDIDLELVESKAEIEMNVTFEKDMFEAKVYVRIK